MKCVHTFRIGRHKRQADITLLFQYTLYTVINEYQILVCRPNCITYKNNAYIISLDLLNTIDIKHTFIASVLQYNKLFMINLNINIIYEGLDGVND